MSRIKSQLVLTETSYAAIYDAESGINRPGFMEEQLRACTLEAVAAGEREFDGVSRFHERLAKLAARGELLPWTFLTSGVYQAALIWDDRAPSQPRHLEDIGASTLQARIYCRSGKLRLSCLSRLGHPEPPIIELRPGDYMVTLERNEEQERAHAGLMTVAAYGRPMAADWLVTLQKSS